MKFKFAVFFILAVVVQSVRLQDDCIDFDVDDFNEFAQLLSQSESDLELMTEFDPGILEIMSWF